MGLAGYRYFALFLLTPDFWPRILPTTDFSPIKFLPQRRLDLASTHYENTPM